MFASFGNGAGQQPTTQFTQAVVSKLQTQKTELASLMSQLKSQTDALNKSDTLFSQGSKMQRSLYSLNYAPATASAEALASAMDKVRTAQQGAGEANGLEKLGAAASAAEQQLQQALASLRAMEGAAKLNKLENALTAYQDKNTVDGKINPAEAAAMMQTTSAAKAELASLRQEYENLITNATTMAPQQMDVALSQLTAQVQTVQSQFRVFDSAGVGTSMDNFTNRIMLPVAE